MKSRRVHIDTLARVEGEGSLTVRIKGSAVEEVRFGIFEPPRFFEAFLRGRGYEEAPDITARICGICPVAYQMSSAQAMEQALGIIVSEPVKQLRRLLYCGEWIESHALHVYLLHTPDFLGFEDSLRLAKEQPDVVHRGLQIKKIGNDLMALIGGREIHPINVRVGGFYKIPPLAELRSFTDRLSWARDASYETVRLVSSFSFPEFHRDTVYVALRHPSDYPMNEGRIVSTAGLDVALDEYESAFAEEHVEYSNALQSSFQRGGHYVVGPTARYNLNYDRLTPLCQQAAREAGLGPTCENPFMSIIVRSIEMLYACEEALSILESFRMPDRPFTAAPPRAGTGYGCTEAPRGMLYHRYRLNEEGTIVDATIVPPTSQNQRSIEEDVRTYATDHIADSTERLTWGCEQAVRNYDPCISCATHFLKLDRMP